MDKPVARQAEHFENESFVQIVRRIVVTTVDEVTA
jgi:hypothetical protein